MFKAISTRITALRARFLAWRARKNPRHAVPERAEVVVRKTVAVAGAVAFTALLVLSPWSLLGLLYVGFTLWALVWLTANVYTLIAEAV